MDASIDKVRALWKPVLVKNSDDLYLFARSPVEDDVTPAFDPPQTMPDLFAASANRVIPRNEFEAGRKVCVIPKSLIFSPEINCVVEDFSEIGLCLWTKAISTQAVRDLE